MSYTLPPRPTTLGAGRGHEKSPGRERPIVRGFEPSCLPWVAAADFGAARVAAARFGSSPVGHPAIRRVKLTIAPFGDLSLAFSDLGPAAPPAESDALFRVRRGAGHAWVIVDGLAGLRIVAAVLGLPGPRLLRRMSATERGVLAAVLASALRAAPGTSMTAAMGFEWSGAGLARILVSAESELVREHVFIDVPPAWIPVAPDSHDLMAAMQRRDLRVSLSLELARTTVSAAEWSGARAGDAVVFDVAAPTGTPRGALIVGDYLATTEIIGAGQARLRDEFRLRDRPARSPMPEDSTQKINRDVIASAPIEIVAELGRAVLRADEVMALGPGSILTFGALAPAMVELRVGDQRWATGELVNVEGQLGVRLLAVATAAVDTTPPLGEGDTLRP
jgi:type III secretion system YscQ/HrcQ family protein